MGDRRYEPPYQQVRDASDKIQALAALSDEEVVAALAAASRAQDPYLANVLATAAQNRLRRAAAISDNIGQGLCTLDRHGIVLQANPAALHLLERPAEALVGHDLHGIVHAHMGPQHSHGEPCHLRSLLESDTTARAEDAFTRLEASLLPVDVTVSPILADDVLEGHVVLFQDISSRKQAEAQLQRQARILESTVEQALEELTRRKEAEERFRQLFDSSPDSVVVTDGADRVLLLNHRAEATFGPGEKLIGKPADVLLSSIMDDGSVDISWRDLGRTPVVTARRQDGTTFQAEVATSSLANAGQRVRITTLRDVTARQLAEERLRRKETLLRNAESLAGVGSWHWDMSTDHVSWSDELYRIHGYAPGEIHMDFAAANAHVFPEDRAKVAAALQAAAREGLGFDLEYRIQRSDGAIRLLHSKGSCIRDPMGPVAQMFGTGQDVTEQREIEAALRWTESRFNQVVESVPEAILILDQDGSVAYANPAAHAAQAGLEGAGPEWVQSWKGKVWLADGSLLGDVDGAFKEILAGGRAKDLELVVDQPDGRRVFLLVNAVPLQSGEHPPSVLASLRDVTALREARQRYEDLNATLEQKVAQQTETLRISNRELQAFAYTVSHDLQAPLRAIDFLADDIQETCGGRLGAEEKAHLARIQKEVGRMRQLVHDLLELSKLNVDEVHRTSVDLTATAEEILEAWRGREPGRQVDARVAPDLRVEGDPGLVRVLLENLLGNAWKYTSRVEGEARIEVGATAAGAFYVRDNGAGFDMSRAGALFQPFVRLHPRTEYEGTGIGLATVSRIVRKHGGKVWVESTPGKGATFFFTLGPDDAPRLLV